MFASKYSVYRRIESVSVFGKLNLVESVKKINKEIMSVPCADDKSMFFKKTLKTKTKSFAVFFLVLNVQLRLLL
jgi:hypothetical protein